MKVLLDRDEWYPVFTARTAVASWRTAKEVPDDFMDRYDAVMKAFDEMQEELANLWHAA